MPDIWSILNLSHHSSACKNCGQPALPAKGVCKMCETIKNGAALAVCRSLLIKSMPDMKDLKKKQEAKGKDGEMENVREVALFKVLSQFPFELASRTAKFKKSCDSDGVWFAHINAYQMLKPLRPSDTPANDLARDPLYLMIRDEFYLMLSKGPQSLNNDRRETIESAYNNPSAPMDGYRVISHMVMELEKEGKLQIARPKQKCPGCGKEIPEGSACPDCNEDAALDRRLSISAGLNMGASADPPPIAPTPKSGMHSKE